MDLTFNYQQVKVPDEAQNTSTLTTHFVDQDGTAIAPEIAQSGLIGDKFTTTASHIDGYTLLDQATQAGTFTGNVMDLTFNYRQVKTPDETQNKSLLTAHFVDQDGKTIAPESTQSGLIGDKFTATAGHIDGYTLLGQPTQSGTFIGNTMDLTFNYQQVKVPDEAQRTSTLTTHFVDQDGNPIAPDTVQTGSIGDRFTTTAVHVDGYHLLDRPTQSGTFTGNAMTVTFNYQQATIPSETQSKTTLTTLFVDQDGNPIAPDTTQAGSIGDTFTTTAIAITGYIPVGQLTQTGTFTGNAMAVTFNYQRLMLPSEAHTRTTLTTHFVDQDGNPIAPARTQTGTIGDPFSTTAVSIDGYRLLGQPAISGVFQGNAMQLTFTYRQQGQPANTATTKLITRYVDDHQRELAPATVQFGTVGTGFTVVGEPISGYRVIGRYARTGTYHGDVMTLTFVYHQQNAPATTTLTTPPTTTATHNTTPHQTPSTETNTTTSTPPATTTTGTPVTDPDTATSLPPATNDSTTTVATPAGPRTLPQTGTAGQPATTPTRHRLPNTGVQGDAVPTPTTSTTTPANSGTDTSSTTVASLQQPGDQNATRQTLPETGSQAATRRSLPETGDHPHNALALLGLSLLGLIGLGVETKRRSLH